MILDKIVESTKIRVAKLYETADVEQIKSEAVKMAEKDNNQFCFEKRLMTKPIAFI